MAVGHARERERGELLRKLVVIGDQRPSQRRRYHLLAAASLENATTLDPAVRAEVMSRAAFLIPRPPERRRRTWRRRARWSSMCCRGRPT
ncbi:hypothetical protein ID875_25695 [Streptomyces globisporus]|uniref:Uncharacterized protein n=2 Tax=Streptomyces TaxID=1883 RepID=A0A927BN21_STRGL|nr:hypothetical protein [Streptomyces globisporus]